MCSQCNPCFFLRGLGKGFRYNPLPYMINTAIPRELYFRTNIYGIAISKGGLHLHNPACMASGITWVKVLGFRGADGLDRTAEQTLHSPRHS